MVYNFKDVLVSQCLYQGKFVKGNLVEYKPLVIFCHCFTLRCKYKYFGVHLYEFILNGLVEKEPHKSKKYLLRQAFILNWVQLHHTN